MNRQHPGRTAGRIAWLVIWLAAAFLSVILLRPYVTSVETYRDTIDSIDGKKTTVTELVLASTAAATAISCLPNDVGTPIAEQIAKLGSILGLALGALYLEKYSLTILGLLASAFFFPAACVLMALPVRGRRFDWKRRLAVLLLICGLACTAVIPAGVWVSDRIETTFRDSISSTVESALQPMETETEEPGAEEEEGSGSLWSSVVGFVQNALTAVGDAAQNALNGVSEALEWAKQSLSHFIEAAVILLITNCVIPLLVLFFFVFIVRQVASFLKLSALQGRGRGQIPEEANAVPPAEIAEFTEKD